MSSVTGASFTDETPGPEGEPPLRGDRASTGRLGDRLFGGMTRLAGGVVLAIVVLVGVFLVVRAIPALRANHADFFTSTEWSTSPLKFGIVQLLWTTVATSVIALVIAVPFSIAIALFLGFYAPRWLAQPAAAIIDLLAAVPSIVYGLWGAYIVAPQFAHVQSWIQDAFGWIPLFGRVPGISGGTTIFFVGVVLAIMILPIITALSREVFAQTPMTQREGAIALGATKWEMLRTTVLPFGRPGVISASMLGLGRALGETIAVMLILSTLPQGANWSWSLFNGGSTFASNIAANAPESISDTRQMGAYIAAGLVLFILTFVVNAIARIIIERRKAFSE
ncbi:phosphate ABC transporter permease subunit PstC [Flexivirga caeni]|uniref:Phosphate transport system permease protein n=1 Tax=Flexivirga caeni TaxID=2294115 RepID=A0A3M9MGK3_9MICO|nr:phosphate ABC transporter permease subunit PstC [Flexivirga caeni]RNI23788.1 phosphate ABC transporter permease subunit PstC [Flexivirga caeni]